MTYIEKLARRYWVCLLAGALAISIAVWPQFADYAAANVPSAINQEFSLITYNPPNRGAPGKTADGGSRRCAELVALQPTPFHWGEGTDTHPTFWMYVSGAADSMTLTLADEESGELFYETTFAPTTVLSGVGRYTLPYDAPALALNTPYRWTMTASCPMTDGKTEVNGVIMRRAMPETLQAELSESSPRDRILLLAANGLWYDAVDELAELRLANAGDETLTTDWESLLKHTRTEKFPNEVVNKPLHGEYPERL